MTFDEIMQEKFIAYLKQKGNKVEADNTIEHDIIVNDTSWELKFFRNCYPEVYLELYQCADPMHCPICKNKSNPKIMEGWAYRGSYSTAEYIVLIHTKDLEIKQIVLFEKKKMLDWYWDVYAKNNKVQKMIASWEGRHRTLGVAIPFSKIPVGLISITTL